MAKKPAKDSPTKLRPDAAETAFRVMQEAVGEAPKTPPPGERSEAEKHPAAVKRGQKGGEKGGRVRAETLSPDELAESARRAAAARWAKQPNKSD